jgi:hypothetical protein
MATVDVLRNNLIDKLLTISDKDYLSALYKLVQTNSVESKKVSLTEEQQLMLKMSDNDIANGKLISQADLDKRDLEWLKGL